MGADIHVRDLFIAQLDPPFHVVACELACRLVARGVDACAHRGLTGRLVFLATSPYFPSQFVKFRL